MGKEITTKWTLELDEFFQQWDQVSDTLGKIDDAITKSSKKNPLAEAAVKAVQFNQQLGMQVQIWQRVETATASYRKEQDRVKKVTGEIKAAQNELVAAASYGELKKQIGQVEIALEKGINNPLKESISWWDKLKAKVAEGLKIPKIDMPIPKRDDKGRFLGTVIHRKATPPKAVR